MQDFFLESECDTDGLSINVFFDPSPDINLKISNSKEVSVFDTYHTHTYYELFYAKETDFTFHTKEKDIIVPKGFLLLVSPDFGHYVTNLSKNPQFYFTVKNSNKEASNKLLLLKFLATESFYYFKADNVCNMLLSCIEDAHFYKRGKEMACYMCGLLLHISDLGIVSNEISSDTENSRLLKLEFLIGKSIIDNLNYTLSDIAKELNISPRHLSRIVKKTYGCRLNEELIKRRMVRAIQLFESGKSISETAAEVGYSTLNGFYSAFYSVFGETPGEFKKKTQNENNE